MTKTKQKLIKEETSTKIILSIELNEPTVEEITEAIKIIKEQPKFDHKEKFIVNFSKPIEIKHSRGKKITSDEIKVKFFHSSSDRLAYTFHSRTGYPIIYIDYKKIVKISYTIVKDKNLERKNQIQKILKRRYDEKTWSHLKAENLEYQNLTIINIKQKFPNFVINELKQAFENKTDYHFDLPGEKRDLSVSTRMGDDGVFRAWFSSEYAGCGNGQYYLLLNPTTACFCEWD